MIIARATPIVVRNGQKQAITSMVIAELPAEGMTPRDYELVALVADFYGLTIPELMRPALESRVM